MEAKSIPPIETTPIVKSKRSILSILTVILLIATVCLIGVFGVIFIQPQSLLNPFPPITVPAAVIIPTSTAAIFPATWTPTATLEPSPTAERPTEIPTAVANTVPTILPSSTSAPAVEATKGGMVTLTPVPAGAFAFDQRGETNMLSSAIIHPDQGCKWLGVGGQTFDIQGSPLVGVSVQLTGGLEGKPVSMLSLTGTATQYGPAGYEFVLADHPVDSSKGLTIQLLDQAGLPLSDKISFDTSSDCQKNLVLINFRQVK
jgi:hypothetical protein